MSDVTLDLRGVPKARAYEQLDAHVRAVLEDGRGLERSVACLAEERS